MAQKKYLDLERLQYFYNKLKEVFLPKSGGTVTGSLDINNDLTVSGDIHTNGSIYGGAYGSGYQIDSEGNFHTCATINFNQAKNEGSMVYLIRYTYSGSHPIISVDVQGSETTIGNDGNALFFEGSAVRPMYNDVELVLKSDMVVCTQDEYDQLPAKEDGVLYFIKESA